MTLFLLIGGVSALYLGSILSSRWPALPLVGVAVLICFAWESPNTPTLLYAAGTRVAVADALAVLVLTTAIVNFVSKKVSMASYVKAPLIILFIMLGFSLAKGIFYFQFGPTINESRLVVLTIAFAVWATSVNWIEQAKLLVPLALFLGWGLTLAAVYHSLIYGVGDASSQVQATAGEYQTGRVLVSGQALVLVLCTYITIWHWMKVKSNAYLISVVAFVVVVIMAQHRSVWLALIVASLLMWLISSNLMKEKIVVIVAGAVISLTAFRLAGFADSFFADLVQALEDDRTYEARQGSWIALVDQYLEGGAMELLTGFPFGSGFERVEPNGQVVSFQPHNWYVTLLLRTGILGLAAWILISAQALIKAWRNSNMLPFAMISTVSIYSWTYAINWYVGVFVGLAVALAAEEKSRTPLTRDGAPSLKRAA